MQPICRVNFPDFHLVCFADRYEEEPILEIRAKDKVRSCPLGSRRIQKELWDVEDNLIDVIRDHVMA